MSIPKWSSLADPTYLDCPIISRFAAKGWDMDDEDSSSSGNAPYPVKNLGIPDSQKKGKVTKEISTKQVQSVDAYLKYCKKHDIAVKNEGRMTLINGRIIEIENELGFIKKDTNEALLVCFACAKYKPFTDMQGDHFQSKAHINKRLISFYKDENYQKNKKNPNFKKMFIIDKKEFAPNYFYGLGFHFSEDNIWPLCSVCNGLNGKNNKDPFTFLKTQELYGEKFLKKLPAIDDQGILIRAGNDHTTIAEFAIKHFAKMFKDFFLKKQLFDSMKIKFENEFTRAIKDNDSEKIEKILKMYKKGLKSLD